MTTKRISMAGRRMVIEAPAPVLTDKQLQSNQPLTSIRVSQYNPRRIDLERAGITLEAVKALAKRQGESKEAFFSRIMEYIDTTYGVGSFAYDRWLALLYLAISILERGLSQSILVMRPDQDSGLYELLAGERRYLSHWLAGLSSIEAVSISRTNHVEIKRVLVDQLEENTLRDNLSIPAMIHAVKQINAQQAKPITVRDISRTLGISVGYAHVVSQASRLDSEHEILKRIFNFEYENISDIKAAIDQSGVADDIALQKRPAKKASQPMAGQGASEGSDQPSHQSASGTGDSNGGVGDGRFEAAAQAEPVTKDISRPDRQTVNEPVPYMGGAGENKGMPANQAPSASHDWDAIRAWLWRGADDFDLSGTESDLLDAVSSEKSLLAAVELIIRKEGDHG